MKGDRSGIRTKGRSYLRFRSRSENRHREAGTHRSSSIAKSMPLVRPAPPAPRIGAEIAHTAARTHTHTPKADGSRSPVRCSGTSATLGMGRENLLNSPSRCPAGLPGNSLTPQPSPALPRQAHREGNAVWNPPSLALAFHRVPRGGPAASSRTGSAPN